jgi:RNA methyltransferase, TrmH family
MLSKNQVKYLHSLRLAKFRGQDQVFIAEGVKLIDDLLHSEFRIRDIYATEDWIKARLKIVQSKKIVFREITEEELGRISNLVSPNEALAVVEIPKKEIPGPEKPGKIVLMLDRIQDPGNLGTIIRTADWFGIRDIFCSAGTVELYNPKVVQATMGSICRVNVYYADLKDIIQQFGPSRRIYGTTMDGENIYTAALEYPAAIVIGNESKGISEDLFALLTKKLGILSASSGAESLNASVAAGIVMSEFIKRL